MFSNAWATAGLLATFAINAINAIDPISVVGSKFFYPNGTQYFIKGMPSSISPHCLALDSINRIRNCISVDGS